MDLCSFWNLYHFFNHSIKVLIHSQNYRSFVIYFVCFLTARFFSKIVCSEKKISNFDRLQSSIIVENFNNHLEKYKTINESESKKEKYVTNTLNNLKLDLM
mgnify:CR=1 FL=1